MTYTYCEFYISDLSEKDCQLYEDNQFRWGECTFEGDEESEWMLERHP